MRKLLIISVVLVVLFTGLKIFQSLSEVPEEDVIYNSLKSIKDSDDFTFVVLGDNKNSISTFGKIIRKINADNQVSFVVNTGDMVFDGSPIKYEFLMKQLRKLKKPILTTLGNHDIADNGLEIYTEIFGPMYYSFHVGPAYFIVLDNSNEKDVDPYQMEWLKKELKLAQKYEYRFVFFHVPIFDPRVKKQPGHSMKNLENAKELLKALKEGKVTMVFCGHIHGYFKGYWDGVPYIITGGAGAELVGLDPNHYFYHYIKVHVSKRSVSYELVKIRSPDFNLVDRIGAFLWLYTYSFVVINYYVVILTVGLFIILSILIHGEEGRVLIKSLTFIKNSKLLKIILKISYKIGRAFEKKEE